MNMKMNLATLAVAMLSVSPVAAQAPAEVENQEVQPLEEIGGQRLGKLSCSIEGGWGLLLGSSKKATCDFTKDDGTVEKYTGKLSKLGLDIGMTDEAYMTWVAFTREGVETGEKALSGKYQGISGDVSLGIGLGANALIGGTNKEIGLQPVIAQGANGLNLAVGLASLNLEAAE